MNDSAQNNSSYHILHSAQEQSTSHSEESNNDSYGGIEDSYVLHERTNDQEVGTTLPESLRNMPVSLSDSRTEAQLTTSQGTQDQCGKIHQVEVGADQADIDTVRSMLDLWTKSCTLSAIFAVTGSIRYTVKQYEHSRSHFKDCAQPCDMIWPSYYRIKRTFEAIKDNCLPESCVARLPKRNKSITWDAQNRSAAATIDHTSNDSEQVRIFFPTSWARLGVATSTIFNEIYQDAHMQELDTCQLTLKRDAVMNACSSLFVNSDGNAIRCGPGSIIRISAQKNQPNLNTPFRFSVSQDQHHFDGELKAIWSVTTAWNVSPSGSDALNSSGLSPYETKVIHALLEAEAPQTGTETQGINFPGDVCTLLAAERQCNVGEYVPVLVHRYWRFLDGMPSITVLWICPSQLETEFPRRLLSDAHSEAFIVNEVQLQRRGIDTENTATSSQGKLSDGTPYFMYRILLYCDDFQRSSAPSNKASVGGCCFMPLELRPDQRRTTSSARLISLTLPGVSTNSVLHFIVDDLVHGTVCGVQGFTPSGQRVKIFLDVIGFIGDYPAASAVTAVMGHTGRSPCTLCSLRRLLAAEAQGSKYGYTTYVHANNTAFLRHAERHWALRKGHISKESATTLGMCDSDVFDVEKWPLNHLSASLRRQRHRIPLDDKGKPVVTALLDPYRSNFVAPDHLLTGLAKDILNTIFKCIPTKEMKTEPDSFICQALRENGLPTQKEIYNPNKNKIHSMTLSELFCVLLVAGPCLRIVTAQCSSNSSLSQAVQLLIKLQRLVALTYFWPERDIDGAMAFDFMRLQREEYFRQLKAKARDYVQSVDEFCVSNDIGKQLLDKPNLHRLLELYQHSIPAFGHVREFMELIFESVHQNLKRAIAGSNNHQIQLFAVEPFATNDWQGRIASLYQESKQNDKQRAVCGRRGLRRVLLGQKADLLDEERDIEFIREADERIAALFGNAVVKHLNSDVLISNFGSKHTSVWRASDEIKMEALSEVSGLHSTSLSDILKVARTWIDTLFPRMRDQNGGTRHKLRLFRLCKRVKVNHNEHQTRSCFAFDVLTCSNVMHVYISEDEMDNRLLKYHRGPRTKPMFLLFVAALHRKGDLVWAICKKCTVQGDRI